VTGSFGIMQPLAITEPVKKRRNGPYPRVGIMMRTSRKPAVFADFEIFVVN